MTEDRNILSADELREQAEARLADLDESAETGQRADPQTLIHELRTHQIELELQNVELRRAEQELVEARDRFSDLYDFAPVGYATISDKGLIVQANLTLSTLLGVDRSCLIMQPFAGFVLYEDEDIYYFQRKTAVDSGQRQSFKLRLHRSGGDPFWARLEAIVATQSSSDVLLVAVSDVTEQVSLEGELLQSRKMESIGTLVGGIAHDFNNMLAAITSDLYLAKADAAALPPVVTRLGNVEKQCFRAADMIKQLLTFARKGTVHMLPFNLTSFIKEAIELNRLLIPENISFECDLCEEELPVQGDTTQLQQILMNLLLNARDAVTDAGHPAITVSLSSFTKSSEGRGLGASFGMV